MIMIMIIIGGLDSYEKAATDADKATVLDPKYVKAYSRKGLALMKMYR